MPAPVYARRVVSNVKKGVDVELSRLTLLVGPNGSGKTSVQNALELALCGFASDVEGRDKVKLAYALARLGPGDQPLISNVTLSDGRDASWTLKPNKKGGYHDPEHAPPNGVRVIFPVADVREVLGGSPETIRTWLMGRVSSEVREQDILMRLPDDLQDEYRTASAKFRTMPGWTEIDILLAVIEDCKKEARKLDAQNKGARQTMETMSEGLGHEPSSAEIQEADEEVQLAEREYQAAMMAPRPATPDLSALRGRAEGAVGEYQKAAETARLAHAAIPPLHPQEEALIDFRSKLADICSITDAMGAKNCLCCDSPLNIGLQQRAAHLRRENESGAAAVVAKRLFEKKQQEADTLRQAAEQLIKAFQSAEQEAARLAANAPARVDTDALGLIVVQARSRLNELKMQQRQWKSVRAAKDEIRKTAEAAKNLKALAEEAGTVVDDLLKKAHGKFEKAVQEYLPPGDVFKMVLVENKKPVCRMGFKRGDTLHTALSGAEWARLTMALGCATFKADEKTLAIFTPEERAFDGDTLATVMNALAEAPGQVILQSPTGPTSNYRSEWRVVDMASSREPGPSVLGHAIAEA
jgi:hypothetical protein